MRTSAAGIALIKQSEGFRDTPYADVAGNMTIGYGHKILPGEQFPSAITEAEGTLILEGDLTTVEAQIELLVKVPLTQGQFDALADFTFNEGSGHLASSTLLRLLNAGNYLDSCRCLYWSDDSGEHGWIYAAGKIQPGLIIRRKAEQEMWNS